MKQNLKCVVCVESPDLEIVEELEWKKVFDDSPPEIEGELRCPTCEKKYTIYG